MASGAAMGLEPGTGPEPVMGLEPESGGRLAPGAGDGGEMAIAAWRAWSRAP